MNGGVWTGVLIATALLSAACGRSEPESSLEDQGAVARVRALDSDRALLDWSDHAADPDLHVTNTVQLSAELVSVGGEGGVSIDQNGTVYISNFNTSVWKITTDGAVELLSDRLGAASGNTILPNGDLLQADFAQNRIIRFDAEGQLHDFSSEGLDGPVGLVRATDGSVFVANCLGKSITRIDERGGAAVTIATDARFGCPNGIVVHSSGDLLVADLYTPVVFRVTPRGEVTEYADLGGPGNGHLVSVGDAIYVTQLRIHRIVRLEADGTRRVVAGTGERGFSNGPEGVSMLSHPNGIAADPSGSFVYFNTHIGVMEGGNRGAMVLRKLTLPTG